MPERTSNPYRRDRAVIGGMERHRAWDQGYSAAQADQAAWLASDEAVERVARAMVDQLPGGPWRWQLTTADLGKARAVLAALRGDGDV